MTCIITGSVHITLYKCVQKKKEYFSCVRVNGSVHDILFFFSLKGQFTKFYSGKLSLTTGYGGMGQVERRVHTAGRKHGRIHEPGGHRRMQIPGPRIVTGHAVGTRRRRPQPAGKPAVARVQAAGEEPAEALVALLLRFGGQLAVAGLDVLLLEGGGSGHVVQLVVEPAGVAHGLPVGVAAPQGRGVGAAVCAGRSFTFCRAL